MAESRGESQRENSHSKLWGQLSQEEGSQEGLHGLDPQHLRVSLSSSGLDGQILCPRACPVARPGAGGKGVTGCTFSRVWTAAAWLVQAV